MKRVLQGLLLASMVLFLLAACGGNNDDAAETDNSTDAEATKTDTENNESDDKLRVVTSFTIIQDMAREIGGEDVDIHNLVPTGTDPHEYEPLPEDNKAATDADVLFYNGINLEGGPEGWFFKMLDSVGQDLDRAYELNTRVEPMYITDEDGGEEEVNPHSFIDPAVGVKMAEDMRDALIEIDPDNADAYEERGNAYVDRLKEIDQEYEEKLGSLPEENRILVTSERAFQYMADHYGLEEAFIWAIDTEENGSPDQIKTLVEFVKENDVPVMFMESNVDERPMETVSKESGVRIAEKRIYSDEIGQPGDEVDTYIKYLTYNLDLMYGELSK